MTTHLVVISQFHWLFSTQDPLDSINTNTPGNKIKTWTTLDKTSGDRKYGQWKLVLTMKHKNKHILTMKAQKHLL